MLTGSGFSLSGYFNLKLTDFGLQCMTVTLRSVDAFEDGDVRGSNRIRNSVTLARERGTF